ncbi:MAG: hypothetical protein LBG15_09335 [Dysgonamonadaceae bacterium]|jgi:hypothetical protein|nr:hypothetical protein [Dysgonamonadaceae bacterium]
MNTKKTRLFGDTTPSEIEKREKEINSTILFDDETGIEFQKNTFKETGEPVLCVQVDRSDDVIILFGGQIEQLKNYLNTQFE